MKTFIRGTAASLYSCTLSLTYIDDFLFTGELIDKQIFSVVNLRQGHVKLPVQLKQKKSFGFFSPNQTSTNFYL